MFHHTGGSIDDIVGQVIAQLYESAALFDRAVESLTSKALKHGPSVCEELRRFIGLFETFQTGCYEFYIASRRYGVTKYLREDGSFRIPL
jgi:hypothetical protein